ncbi:MAG TPA: hypothetical protein VFZ40_04915 [Pyrinomonadaceae bacterium]
MTSSNIKLRPQQMALIVSAIFVCLFAAGAQAQAQTSLPRVGTIKDYPATGLMTGCGNLYFYKVADANSTAANYVFLSRGDGSHAWMNLNGRDVLLRKIKSRGDRKFSRYSYQYRDVRVTVEFAEYTAPAGETDHTSKMKITFRRGGRVRIVRAVGGSDC